jgi:DNA primase
MARLDSSELSDIFALVDMEAFLEREGFDFRKTRGKSGEQLNVKECPVCGGSSYKVYLNAETGLGNCFHGDCETKFTKWVFMKACMPSLSNGDVMRVAKDIAEESGWRRPARASVSVSMDTALRLPRSHTIPIKGKNLRYLTSRGIDIRTAEYFRLRFCQKGYFAYEQDGKEIRQRYDNRIIIPIFDAFGDLVSYQGRDITGTADKKYLFPPGFASTGEYLYNAHNAWHAEHLLVGEGAFDVFAQKLAMDGSRDTANVVPVGTFGKHLSPAQLDKLYAFKERGLRMVTFMWDGERRAFEDAIDAALEVHRCGLVARVALLPRDKDPNEVAAEVVRDAYWRAKVINPLSAVALKLSRQYL